MKLGVLIGCGVILAAAQGAHAQDRFGLGDALSGTQSASQSRAARVQALHNRHMQSLNDPGRAARLQQLDKKFKEGPTWPGLASMDPYPNAVYGAQSSSNFGMSDRHTVKYWTPDNVSQVYKFYTSSLPRYGWVFDTTKCSGTKISASIPSKQLELSISYAADASRGSGTAVEIDHSLSTFKRLDVDNPLKGIKLQNDWKPGGDWKP